MKPEGAPGIDVELNHPTDVTFSPVDGSILVAAWHNHKIRRLDPQTGRVNVLVGNGPGKTGDGAAAKTALLNQPKAVALDAAGNIFVADSRNHRIRKIDVATGFIATIAGSGMAGFAGDGGATAGRQLPHAIGDVHHRRDGKVTCTNENPEPGGSITLDDQGNLYVADTYNNRIRKIDLAAGTVTTVAGTGTVELQRRRRPGPGRHLPPAARPGVGPRRPPLRRRHRQPPGPRDRSRHRDHPDRGRQRPGRHSGATAAPPPRPACTARSASPSTPRATSTSPTPSTTGSGGSPNDREHACGPRRRLIATTLLAGIGCGDGAALIPSTSPPPWILPGGLPAHARHHLHGGRHRHRRRRRRSAAAAADAPVRPGRHDLQPHRRAWWSSTGTTTASAATQRPGLLRIVAGVGELAPEALNDDVGTRLNHPTDVIFDAQGRLVIAAWHNSRIKRVDMSTLDLEDIAGTGARSYGGDDGPAMKCDLNLPASVRLRPGGQPARLRSGQPAHPPDRQAAASSRTIAGSGMRGFAGDGGPALQAQFALPVGQRGHPAAHIALADDGTLYLADTENNRIRQISPGPERMVTTVAGNGKYGWAGDGGPATAAELAYPVDVAIGPDKALYIADTENNCVRKVQDGVITHRGRRLRRLRLGAGRRLPLPLDRHRLHRRRPPGHRRPAEAPHRHRLRQGGQPVHRRHPEPPRPGGLSLIGWSPPASV